MIARQNQLPLIGEPSAKDEERVKPNNRVKTLIGIGAGKAAESVFRASLRPALVALWRKFDEDLKFNFIL